jgi:two-component system chemotaxis response regulator CheB
MGEKRVARVLVIDDSAYNRKAISAILDEDAGIEVIGKACDGEEGLEMALREKPDAITLDLEMPRMGGFPFLRILMAKRPTPVVVISSHNDPEKVFRALELGAFDFVAKPTKHISPAIEAISNEVVEKVKMAGGLKWGRDRVSSLPGHIVDKPLSTIPRAPATRIVAIAASTGGPQALTEVLTALPDELDAGIVVVQHMPPKFTTSFASRLDKLSRIKVLEPETSQSLMNGTAYIAPGDACLEVHGKGSGLEVRVLPPNGTERIVPSGDRLFSSVARAAGKRALGIVLTGMGKDGSKGALDLAQTGGVVIAEDERTAVIPGMPAAAIATGAVQYVVPLGSVASFIKGFCEE